MKTKVLKFGWAAIHPKPKGVIFFIGGAFFGSFPNLFYRSLLLNLCRNSYTVIAIPYRFTFRHWSVALSLFSDIQEIFEQLILESKSYGFDISLYENIQQGDRDKVTWIGHSLGCKYIALLELLTDIFQVDNPFIIKNKVINLLDRCISSDDKTRLISNLKKKSSLSVTIEDQHSILLAPAIEGIEGAIPIFRGNKFPRLQRLLSKFGIRVTPSQSETFCLIKLSELFNLTSLISFKDDTRVALPTVIWLINNLDNRLQRKESLEGRHLAPIGFNKIDSRILEEIFSFLSHCSES